jgi:hypothetical protein
MFQRDTGSGNTVRSIVSEKLLPVAFGSGAVMEKRFIY